MVRLMWAPPDENLRPKASNAGEAAGKPRAERLLASTGATGRVHERDEVEITVPQRMNGFVVQFEDDPGFVDLTLIRVEH
jgi:hypothetical protein